LSNDALLVHIKASHAETKGEYGWPRMWKELLAKGGGQGASEETHGAARHQGKSQEEVQGDDRFEPQLAGGAELAADEPAGDQARRHQAVFPAHGDDQRDAPNAASTKTVVSLL
jgi:hypothetical protein